MQNKYIFVNIYAFVPIDKMSLNHVDTFPPFISKHTLTTITNCLQKNNGRSNIFKLAQYFTKLLAIQIAESKPKHPSVNKLLNASLVINTSRKMLTLGSWIDAIEANRYQNINTYKDKLRKLSNYINSIYLLFDNIIFLQRIKAITLFGTSATRISMCAFWFSQLLSMLADIITLYETFEKEKALLNVSKNPTDYNKLRLERTYNIYYLYIALYTYIYIYRLLYLCYNPNAYM